MADSSNEKGFFLIRDLRSGSREVIEGRKVARASGRWKKGGNERAVTVFLTDDGRLVAGVQRLMPGLDPEQDHFDYTREFDRLGSLVEWIRGECRNDELVDELVTQTRRSMGMGGS